MADLLAQLNKMKALQPLLAASSLLARNRVLQEIGRLVLKKQGEILKANRKDINQLKRVEMADRLRLNEKRLRELTESAKQLGRQPDPLRKTLEEKTLPNGLKIKRISVPMGLVGVIYESRPNVTFDLAALAIKSGNALILKGGSEAFCTNQVLVGIIKQALIKQNLPTELVNLVSLKDDWQKILLSAHGLVDVLIPRGGQGLIKWVRENSKIPVIETGAGVCHTFADADCNVKQAVEIITNAKTQRPSVCNALDTLVVHQRTLKYLLPAVAARLAGYKVEVFADKPSYDIFQKIYPADILHLAKPSDFGKEFLSLKMAVKTVKTFQEGLEFVKQKTSGHSEAILSRNKNHIMQFLSEVDAAVVYANASTRFTDGEEFGMGAEVGISTQKLHARGPMGLEALTSYKWVVVGKGQIRV